ncbi:MAG: glycosyltransferase family 39 protein, partial [Anaerolineae bacterium]|nr:glycosyltransferase family 39 protein [Anaerolineae bacterium]
MKSQNGFFLILLVLLLAALMRIGNAGHNSTWSDEGWNRWVVTDTPVETIFSRLAANHHPPAYFMGLALWKNIAGDNRLSLRFLAIAVGMLSVALLYRIGADQFGHRAGLFSALLFAVFEQSVYYGQAVRHYGWLVLGVCLMLLLFLRTLKNPRNALLIAYALSIAFAMYTMYLAVFIWAVQVIAGIVFWRRSPRDKLRLFRAWVGVGLLLLPWFIYALPEQWHKVQAGIIKGYPNSFETTPASLLMMSDLLLGGQFVIGAALIGLALWKIARQRLLTQIVIAVCGVGLFLLLSVLNLFVGLLSERTLFFLLPSILLLLGYGFQQLQPRLQGLLAGAMLVWMLFTPQGIIPRINSDGVARAIALAYNPGDFVLLETGFDDVAFEYELLLTLPPENRQVFRSYYEYDYPDDAAMMNRLNSLLETQQRVWLVYWNVPARMANHLLSLGFTAIQQTEIPIGENDPLYPTYPTIEITLFARPDLTGETHSFGDLFELKDRLVTETIPRGDNLQVDLWWSPLKQVDRDYSVGVFLLDDQGVTRLQHIGPDATQPTTTWNINQLYFDRHTLPIPA